MAGGRGSVDPHPMPTASGILRRAPHALGPLILLVLLMTVATIGTDIGHADDVQGASVPGELIVGFTPNATEWQENRAVDKAGGEISDRIDSVDAHNVIRRVDLTTRQTTTVGPTLVGRAAHAWVPGHATILMAKGSVLYARGATDTTWRAVASFENPELRNATAYVVSPRGDKLILTAPKRLTLAVVLRDSLEAGRSGADIAALVHAWRDAGKLADVDVSEGAIITLGDDRLRKKRMADAVAIHALAATLFPKSYRALDRLGDAQRAGGDTASAIASYRKALELNPKGTDAERAAAAATEKKIAGAPPR